MDDGYGWFRADESGPNAAKSGESLREAYVQASNGYFSVRLQVTFGIKF
jgi:transglutaminase-like putative cysteine protease